jgi:hypothetical protein
MTPEEQLKLKRRVIDFLHKYARLDQLVFIAKLLGVKHD